MKTKRTLNPWRRPFVNCFMDPANIVRLAVEGGATPSPPLSLRLPPRTSPPNPTYASSAENPRTQAKETGQP
jgi:hypothetical protein